MLLDSFLEQCTQQPEALAVQELERRLSYRQLLQSAQAVAAQLQAIGVQAGQPVAIHLNHGIEATIAVFAVLLAGACYVPLDIKNPASRLSYICADAQVIALIHSGNVPAWFNGQCLDINHCDAGQFSPVSISTASLAAILYTSGSTGQPRGVALSHGAIANFAFWAAELLNLQTNDRIASTTPLFFDLSTFDLYAVLSCGASVHLFRPC